MDGEQPDRHFNFSDLDVGRHAPSALAFVLEAQHQHGQAVEGEAPDHAERIGLTQDVDVATAEDDRGQLHADNQVNNAVAAAELFVRTAKPVGQDAIFRYPVQHSIGADDRGIDGAGKDQKTDYDHKYPEYQLQHVRTDHVHGHPRNQVVLVERNADVVGDDHHGKHGSQAGKDKAEDGNDQRRPFQVAQLRTGNFAVHLGQRFFTAHGQHGVAESDQDAEQADALSPVDIFQEPKSFRAEVKVFRDRQRRQWRCVVNDRVEGPAHQYHHHHRGDLHYAERLVTGLFNPLDVFPPVITGHQQGKGGGRVIFIDMRCMPLEHGVHGARDPAVGVGGGKQFIDQAGNVLAGRNAGNGAGENIVEHQRGDAEFGEGAAQCFFHHAIHAAAGEHGAAFHVNRAHGEGKEHDAENEPWG